MKKKDILLLAGMLGIGGFIAFWQQRRAKTPTATRVKPLTELEAKIEESITPPAPEVEVKNPTPVVEKPPVKIDDIKVEPKEVVQTVSAPAKSVSSGYNYNIPDGSSQMLTYDMLNARGRKIVLTDSSTNLYHYEFNPSDSNAKPEIRGIWAFVYNGQDHTTPITGEPYRTDILKGFSNTAFNGRYKATFYKHA